VSDTSYSASRSGLPLLSVSSRANSSAVLFDQVRDCEKLSGAFRGGRIHPAILVERPFGGGNGRLRIGRRAFRYPRQHAAVRRVDDLFHFARFTEYPFPVDIHFTGFSEEVHIRRPPF